MTETKNLTVNLKANISDFDAKLKAVQSRMQKTSVASDILRSKSSVLDRVTTRLANAYNRLTPSIKAAENRMNTAAAATEKTAKASKIAGGEIANIGYQINDIGVMLAAGQSPFVLAMQQGTQLSQVFERLKASGKSVGKAISGALAQVASPLSLLTIGLTFAVAQSVKWFNAWREGKGAIISVSEALKSVNEELDEVTNKLAALEYGTETAEEARLYQAIAEDMRKIADERQIQAEQIRKLVEGGMTLAKATEYVKDTADATVHSLQLQIAANEEILENLKGTRELYESINDTIASATIEREGYLAAERGVAAASKEEAATRASAQQALVIMGRGMEHYRDSSYMAAEATKTMADHKKKLAELDKKQGSEAATFAKLMGEITGSQEIARKRAEQYLRVVTELEVKIGEAAVDALILGGVDIVDGVDAAAQAAARLAANLNISLAEALKLKALGEDPLDPFGGPGRFIRQDYPDEPGGGGGANPLISELENIQNALMTQEEEQLESFARQQEVLQNAYEQRLLTQQEYQNLMEEAQKQHSDRMAELNVYRHGDVLAQTSSWFGDMAGAFRSGNQQMIEVSKKFGAIEALINAYRAFNQTLANPELPWYAKIPAAASVLAAGMNAVNAIKGGGAGGGGGAAVSSSASAVTSQRPLDVRLSGMSADEFISGASIQSLFDRLQDEAGDRGLRVSFA